VTLCAAWIRADGAVKRQLMIATDSRLTGGRVWDSAPKILMVGRSDCALAFAGSTDDAYPLMLQVQYAVAANVRSRARRIDLYAFKGHLLRVLNQCSSRLTPILGQPRHEVRFLFGGWSWASSRFAIWSFEYTPTGFTARSIRPWRFGAQQFTFIGDETHEARDRLRSLVVQRGRLAEPAFDMEPLAVLRDMVASNRYRSIGGWPQAVRIYQHMNVQPFVSAWPSMDANRRTIFGRDLLSYEQTDWPTLDIDKV
jgi:hypothetical protein